jgi:signal transduction histidine kinase
MRRSSLPQDIRTRQWAATRWICAAGLIALLAQVPTTALAEGDCFADTTGGDLPLVAKLSSDPRRRIVQVLAAMAHTTDPTVSPLSRAHLFAMLMDAYERSGDIAAARAAAQSGLEALTIQDRDGLRRRLQFGRSFLLEQQGHLHQALQEYEAQAARVPQGVADYVCILMDRGYLRQRAGRSADATRDLLGAYRLALDAGNARVLAEASNMLAMLYARYGFFDEAISLANSAIDAYSLTADRYNLAWAHFYRGDVSLQQMRLDAAEGDFRKALELFRAEESPTDAEAVLQRICETVAKYPHRADAVTRCQEAYAEALKAGDRENAKLVLGSWGQALLNASRPRAATQLLDRALAKDEVDISPRMAAQLHRVRGLARSLIGDQIGAVRDLEFFADWLEADVLAERNAEITLLRVKFDAALQERELAKARAEATAARAIAAREAMLRNLVGFIAATLVLGGLLTAWLVRNRNLARRVRRTEQERLSALGRLTGGIAHEYNNRLAVMQLAIGLLLARPSVACDPCASELVKELELSSQASADITAQLQSFGRQQNLQPKAIPLSRWFDEIRSMLEKAAGERVLLKFEADTPESRAWADERLLANALLNLTINARDAMPAGGTVIIRAARSDSARVKIEVVDSGIGMTPEILAHAVEPFYSTKAFAVGAGLGLSVVEGFVTQSGGAMTITSEPGVGTTVTLWLPSAGNAA